MSGSRFREPRGLAQAHGPGAWESADGLEETESPARKDFSETGEWGVQACVFRPTRQMGHGEDMEACGKAPEALLRRLITFMRVCFKNLLPRLDCIFHWR